MNPSTIVFVCIVAVVALLWLLAIGGARGLSPARRAWLGLAILLVWIVLPACLASAGSLDRYTPLPAPALVLIAALTVANVVLIGGSAVGAAVARSVPLAWLVGFQAFRIAVEWWLHRAFEEGLVPVQMTYAGRNFDIISGLTALLLGVWLATGRPPRWIVPAWNVLGLALLANIVTVAVLSTPTPFRAFPDGPANLLPSMFPYIWLPSFLVQAALAGHLLVFRALRPRRQ